MEDYLMTPQLRFSEFTDAWQVKSLGDIDIYVADGNYGEMYPKASEMKDSGVPFIRANNLKNGKLTWRDMKYIDNDLHKVLQSGHLKTGDTLITTRGDIGITALVTSDFDDANINAQICLLRSGRELVSEYIFQTLQTRQSKSQIMSLQTGSALKQLPKGKLALVKLGIPSKPEQEKIADFLTAVDERIRLGEQKLVSLEQYKRGVMQQIFSQKIRFKDENGNEYPEWEEKKLAGVVDFIQNGLSTEQGTTNTGYRVTRIETISDNAIDPKKIGYISTNKDISHYKLRTGDMLFSNINSPAHIGRTVYVDDDYDIYHGMNLLRIRINKNNDSKFAYYVLSSAKYKQWFERICNKAVNQASINQTDLGKTELILPILEEQQKIAAFFTALDDKITAEKSKLTAAKQFKKALLQRMFV